MDLTLNMIAESLNDRVISVHNAKHAQTAYDKALFLLEDEDRLDPGQVYIVDGDRLGSLHIPDASCLIICTRTVYEHVPCPIIICDGSVNEVYKAVTKVFTRHMELEQSIQAALLESRDLNRIIEPISRFLNNPIQVYAPLFNIVAGITPDYDTDGVFRGLKPHRAPMPPEYVRGIVQGYDVEESLKSPNPQIIQYPGFDCACMQINLVDGQHFIGRLVLIELYESFTPAASDVMNAVAKFIRHYLIHTQPDSDQSILSDEHAISEILSGKIIDNRYIASLLSAISWPVKDSFGILFFQLPTRDLPTNDLASYHVAALRKLLPNSIVLAMDGGVVSVFRSKAFSPKDLESMLNPYLLSSGIKAGLGEQFLDFSSARSCYLQAQAAVHTGAALDNQRCFFYYQEFALEHFVITANSTEFGMAFIHPTISQIEEHDIQNQTSLLITLQVFLEAQGNQVEAAQRLHIHRNSLKYRLQRIREITGIDLRDSNLHLRLFMSILLRQHLAGRIRDGQ